MKKLDVKTKSNGTKISFELSELYLKFIIINSLLQRTIYCVCTIYCLLGVHFSGISFIG